MNINILDTDAGNLKSVENFFTKNFSHNIFISEYKYADFSDTDLLVIPGVGNFGYSGKIVNDHDKGNKIKEF